jgi:hypothetical protein
MAATAIFASMQKLVCAYRVHYRRQPREIHLSPGMCRVWREAGAELKAAGETQPWADDDGNEQADHGDTFCGIPVRCCECLPPPFNMRVV